MPEITTLFIDDGGVMNDNALRGTEWRRLVAEFFVPILGGDDAVWQEANRAVIDAILKLMAVCPEEQDYAAWWDACQVQWLQEMAAFVGVTVPADNAQCLKMACDGISYITERVRSAYPGAAKAIQALRGMGFTLFTASGEHSRELDGYLKGMGIREYFHTLYGPDLVNQGKYSIEYYRLIFAHSGVVPVHALVVDDNPQNLAWAGSLGAATCLVSQSPPPRVKANLIVSSLSDLPTALGLSI